jgi:hypothetical protein
MNHAPFPTRRIRPWMLAVLPVVGMAAAAVAQPANDACANAVAIGNTSVGGTTTGASNDGSAACGASSSNVDVWYRYTASSTAVITVQTCGDGTTYDSVLSVHPSACPGTSGNQIACNDDNCGLDSSLTFQAVNGTQYLIRVSGFSSSSGNFELSVGPGGGGQPPANDTCAAATAIGNGSFNGTTNNAIPDGASTCVGSDTPDVYYRYTAPASGLVTASTCTASSYDTVVSVHSACPATTENQIACNNDTCGLRAEVTFTAKAGSDYIVRVAGASGAGTFTLTMGEPPPPGPNGPDVTYQEVTDIQNYGAVAGVRGYALGSSTCNIGDQNLLWTNGGTPALAMNAYRLHNGRLVQIGLGNCKTACCAAAGSGCGNCNGAGGSVLGAGCRDVYGAGFNGIQSNLAPRSAINAYSGAIGSFPRTNGDVIFRRLQIAQADMSTTTYPGSLYFVEGQYIASDDAPAGNALNNASHKRVIPSQSTFDLAMTGPMVQHIPAIQAWRDHGAGANTPDPTVSIFTVDVPEEGRYWVATKVTQLEENRYLYDYAIFNLNSDRAGGSFSVPVPANVKATAIGFHDVDYHSGEPYDLTDWSSAIADGALTWSSPQTFAQNPNSNALRWGTMYNFWFEANTAPVTGQVTLGLFKPHTTNAVSFDAPVPSGSCTADWNEDGTVTSQDFFDFLAAFFNNNADFNGDGMTTSQDFFDFLAVFFVPC